MQEYFHSEINDHTIEVRKFLYKGQNVLLRKRTESRDNTTTLFVTVVGYIKDPYKEQRENYLLPVTQVEPITNRYEKIELTDILNDSMRTETDEQIRTKLPHNMKIDFWS